MEGRDDQFQDAVDESLVDELYTRSRASFLGLVLVLVILRLFLDDVFHRAPGLPIAFWTMSAVVAARVVKVLVARRKQGFFASTRHRHVAFGVGSTATALGFCAMNLAAYPHLDAVQIATLAVVYTGVNAIALLSMGSSPVLYHLYMLPILLPMIGMTALGPAGPGLRLLPVMIVLFVTVLSMMALHEWRLRRDNVLLRLRVSEMALVDALTKLRNRRYLHEFMASEVEQVLRDWSGPREPKRRLWLMMVDLDHFKSVND
ncbi:MAG: diguanylate cyclase [Deltaproteobacteria bacterium]|nr:diguanylate cyclase [Deltaproteobacteria bacterium]